MPLRPDVFYAQCGVEPSASDTMGSSTGVQWLECLWCAMGLDPANPFQEYLKPNQCAVIKPNWVMHWCPNDATLACLLTSAELVLYVAEYCAKAMGGQGRVIIGDAPIQGCDLESLLQQTGMNSAAAELCRRYPQLQVEIQDWRLTVMRRERASARLVAGEQIDLDPQAVDEYAQVDLGQESFLEEIADHSHRFRAMMYQPSLLSLHHSPGMHQYLVRKCVLNADLFVNLPKMKTHEKAGLTGAMKNLVGTIGHKGYLPHHVKGAYFAGGDSYCISDRFAAWAEDLYDRQWENRERIGRARGWLREKIHRALQIGSRIVGGNRIPLGSWCGNDTICAHYTRFEPHRVFRTVPAGTHSEHRGRNRSRRRARSPLSLAQARRHSLSGREPGLCRCGDGPADGVQRSSRALGLPCGLSPSLTIRRCSAGRRAGTLCGRKKRYPAGPMDRFAKSAFPAAKTLAACDGW